MGLLAGVSGAAFAAVAAGLFHLSKVIAATVAGVLFAAVVGYLAYRHPPGSATDGKSERTHA
jgi:hypothetical protein